MAITVNSLWTAMYSISGTCGCAVQRTPSVDHEVYNAADCKIIDTWSTPFTDLNKKVIAGTKNALGTLYYLPYVDNKVTSMRLPSNPGNTDVFFTANLSGCRFFIDTVQNSQDVIVMHANTHQHGSAVGSPSNSQSVAAGTILDNLHQSAIGDYAADNPAVVVVPGVSCNKVDYMRPGEVEVLRKRGHGRKQTEGRYDATAGGIVNFTVPLEFIGGTTIVGFFNGGWEFHYQTWGMVEYVRPDTALGITKQLLTFRWQSVHNARTKDHRVASNNSDQWVLDTQRIY